MGPDSSCKEDISAAGLPSEEAKPSDGIDDSDLEIFQPYAVHKSEMKGRQKYSDVDDHRIIRFLVDNNRVRDVGGNTLWRQMQSLEITCHSSQSMKDRFRKQIIPNLDEYIVPDSWKRKLRGIGNSYTHKPQTSSSKDDFDQLDKLKSAIVQKSGIPEESSSDVSDLIQEPDATKTSTRSKNVEKSQADDAKRNDDNGKDDHDDDSRSSVSELIPFIDDSQITKVGDEDDMDETITLVDSPKKRKVDMQSSSPENKNADIQSGSPKKRNAEAESKGSKNTENYGIWTRGKAKRNTEGAGKASSCTSCGQDSALDKPSSSKNQPVLAEEQGVPSSDQTSPRRSQRALARQTNRANPDSSTMGQGPQFRSTPLPVPKSVQLRLDEATKLSTAEPKGSENDPKNSENGLKKNENNLKKNGNNPKNKNEDDPKKNNEDDPKKNNEDDPKKKNEDDPKNKNEDDPKNKNEDDPKNKNEDDPKKNNEDDPKKNNEDDPKNKNEDDPKKNNEDDPKKNNEDDPKKNNEDDPKKKNESDPTKIPKEHRDDTASSERAACSTNKSKAGSHTNPTTSPVSSPEKRSKSGNTNQSSVRTRHLRKRPTPQHSSTEESESQSSSAGRKRRGGNAASSPNEGKRWKVQSSTSSDSESDDDERSGHGGSEKSSLQGSKSSPRQHSGAQVSPLVTSSAVESTADGAGAGNLPEDDPTTGVSLLNGANKGRAKRLVKQIQDIDFMMGEYRLEFIEAAYLLKKYDNDIGKIMRYMES